MACCRTMNWLRSTANEPHEMLIDTQGHSADVPGSLLTTMPAFNGVVLWYLHGR